VRSWHHNYLYNLNVAQTQINIIYIEKIAFCSMDAGERGKYNLQQSNDKQEFSLQFGGKFQEKT
jgi:hypothetical protein